MAGWQMISATHPTSPRYHVSKVNQPTSSERRRMEDLFAAGRLQCGYSTLPLEDRQGGRRRRVIDTDPCHNPSHEPWAAEKVVFSLPCHRYSRLLRREHLRRR